MILHNNNKLFFLCSVMFLVMAALAIVSANDEGANSESNTRITSYQVNTAIASRFARTKIILDMVNMRNCSTRNGITLQLPLNARVTSLNMSLSDGCHMDSVVKKESEAISEFDESVREGKPAALLEAYDASNYVIQVSLPPNGETRVELVLEELLYRKQSQIAFQIPIFPGLSVESLSMDISVIEPTDEQGNNDGGATLLNLVLPEEQQESGGGSGDWSNVITQKELFNGTGVTAHLEVSNVNSDGLPEGSAVVLPRLLKGYYDSNQIPSEGLLLPDPSGTCFVHLFNPTDAVLQNTGPMPRNLVFVIDVSGSMQGQKLDDAKAAFAAIIDQLSAEDSFVVHTFSDQGVEDFVGPLQANEDAKAQGKAWVQGLQTISGTNVEAAYIAGIERAAQMQANTSSSGEDESDTAGTIHVPVVLVLTDGQASSGVTDAVTISRNVKQANRDVKAKVYALAFGEGADFSMLSAIAIQNDGTAVRIYEGYGDAAEQMKQFYVGELGTVLLSDVSIIFQGNVPVDTQTKTRFPVFSLGSEIAVRAKMINTDVLEQQQAILGVTTYGMTPQGPTSWRTEVDLNDPFAFYVAAGDQEEGNLQRSECLQSFTHAKISDLMLFHDAALLLGSDMNEYAHLYMMQNGISWTSQDNFGSGSSSSSTTSSGGQRALRDLQGVDLAPVAKSQALDLALEAGLVWPALTAMVTMESPSCSLFGTSEVCYEGDGGGGDMAAGETFERGKGSSDSCWSCLSFLSVLMSVVTVSWMPHYY